MSVSLSEAFPFLLPLTLAVMCLTHELWYNLHSGEICKTAYSLFTIYCLLSYPHSLCVSNSSAYVSCGSDVGHNAGKCSRQEFSSFVLFYIR
uniref:Secreted protein n=1 Tax=Rhipicephalus appendiculatus TaxID=34631 RepID=A0A131YEC5_RHIAP